MIFSKIGVLSLGCPRNLVDSENILGRLKLKGYSVVDMNKADIALINTCAFIDSAKEESIDAILDLVKLKKSGSLKKIIVYGCLAQRYKEELKQALPEVDAFVGKISLDGSLERFAITPAHFAYLKICEGCVNRCSYCVIPKIKGKFVSLDEAAVLKQVQAFDKAGLSELNIVGQDITGYPKLAQLVKKIDRAAKNIGWIRLLYLNPERISDELLEVIRTSKKICKYIDLPVQHINDRILKLMNRGPQKAKILKLLAKIRKTIPDVALRTSVIVGFPSETEREFGELLEFLKEARFERLGAFVYSREEGTPAYKFPGQVPEKVKQERFNRVMSLQQEISRSVNEKFLGKTLKVLIDEVDDGSYLGRSQFDAPEVDGLVYVNSRKKLEPGDFTDVKITDTLEYDLVGEALK